MRGKAAIRREVVAHGLAAGKTVKESMLDAGYAETTARLGMIARGKHGKVSPWDHPEVAARVAEIRDGARKLATIGTADVVLRLEGARLGAMEAGQFSAASGAAMNMARVLGLVVDRTRFEGLKPISEMTEPELAAFLKLNGMDPDGTGR